MKSITEWLEDGCLSEADEFAYSVDNVDQDWIQAFVKVASNASNELIHAVDTPSEYKSRVRKALGRVSENWNRSLKAVEENGKLDLKELKTATLGAFSSAWFVLFEAARSQGAEYAFRKGRQFTSYLNKEIGFLSDAWIKIKAGKPI